MAAGKGQGFGGVDNWNTSSDYSSLAYTPPQRPGLSAYRIKGLAYRGFFEDCERAVPGGKAGFLKAIQQPELYEFFSQEFMAATWFDVFPLPLGRQIAMRLAGKTYLDHLRAMMRITAQRDIDGVHHAVLDVALPPQTILDRLERITNQYFNFSPLVRSRVLGPTEREAYRDDFPELLVPWYRPVAEGYAATVLELCGAREVQARVTVKPTPARRGLAMVSLRIGCSWSDPSR